MSAIRTLQEMPLRENGGYFVLRPEIFDHIPTGGDLVADALVPLAAAGRVLAHAYDGYWHPADTVKERASLEAAYRAGETPWMVWDGAGDRSPLQSMIAGLVGAEQRY